MVVKVSSADSPLVTHVVRVVISPRVLTAIPAKQLRGLSHDGSVADLLDALFTRMVRHGIRAYEKGQKR
jgi:hypothetical protein